MASQRLFIENVEAQVERAKELVLPLLMLEHSAEPWSSASLLTLQRQQETLGPVVREALTLLYEYELPFLQKEESLIAAGISLETDLLSFEEEMLEFERAFWNEKFQASRDAAGGELAEAFTDHDLCNKHRLSKDFVRRMVIAHELRDFDEIAPLVGAEQKCGHCRLGITRLLIEILKDAKAKAM